MARGTGGGYFFYMHPDLMGTPDVWKIGVSLTPYSAVRARQKFCWNPVALHHLWFGYPPHVATLEANIKSKFKHLSGNRLQKIGCQTELLKSPVDDILLAAGDIIKNYDLCIKKVFLNGFYTANRSTQCPLGCKGEKTVHPQLNQWCRDEWPQLQRSIRVSNNQFNQFFVVE